LQKYYNSSEISVSGLELSKESSLISIFSVRESKFSSISEESVSGEYGITATSAIASSSSSRITLRLG